MSFDIDIFNQECSNIIRTTTSTQACVNLFELPTTYTVQDVNQAYRKLSKKYHPDKNPNSQALATQVMRILNNAKNHLITGENLQKEALKKENLDSDDYKFLNSTELLDELEEMINEKSSDRLPGLIEELKARISKNKNYLKVTASSEKTILRLAAELNDINLFSWLCDQGDNPLFCANNTHCALHYLIGEKKKEMLTVIASKYSSDWLNRAYLYTIRTLKCRADILDYCVSYLQKNNIPIETTLDENPFLKLKIMQNNNCGGSTN